jgi:hypothetical protein
MIGTMTGEGRRAARPGRWARWCAAALLALLALTTLHAAVPHDPVQRHCMACQALHAPALPGSDATPGPVTRRATIVTVTRRDTPLPAEVRRLRPLRAPPASA